MDAEFEDEQIGTLFVWVGARVGVWRGGWYLRGVQPKNRTCLISCPVSTFCLPGINILQLL